MREHIIPDQLNVTAAAKALGVTRPTLSKFLNGRSKLSAKMSLRLENVFGANSQELLDMQVRYDSELNTVPMTLQTYAPTVISIGALDIDRWANRIVARHQLPALLRILVHSTGANLTEVDFPAYDNAERKGWDGYVEAGSATPWIPAGKSGWEFGCDSEAGSKANSDYDNRTGSVSKEERRDHTFVFVTPRNWKKKRIWVERRKSLRQWKDVRAFDASDLEQWVEQSVPAQIWLAERLGIVSQGLRSLDQCWSEWASVCNPELSPRLFDYAISRHRENLSKWFGKAPSQPMVVAADSKDEALAFLSCLAREGSADRRLFRRAIVVDTPVSLRSLSSAPDGSLVLIVHTKDVELQLGPLGCRFHCIVVRPSGEVAPDSTRGLNPTIVLERPRPQDFNLALDSMGSSRHDIEQLARESGHSPTILRRRLAKVPTLRTPAWAETDNARKLLPAVLVGAWDSESSADREIVSMIAGGDDYKAVESDFASVMHLDDCPIWSVGQYRGVASRIDALFAVSRFITKDDLDTFFFTAEYVLSERDPALDLPEDERWAAQIYHKVRNHSDALRRSIRETLILLAVFGKVLFLKRTGVNSEVRVDGLIGSLLSPLTLHKLLSHLDDLPDYAEAAPDVFLRLIEDDLSQEEPITLELMTPTNHAVTSSPIRTGLLWALETVAWQSASLPRVVSILAQLSSRKITDNWINKPEHSLGTILSSWMPQTAAPLEQRVRTVELLATRFPHVAWNLCMGELDPGPRIATPNRRPRWRQDAKGAGAGAPGTEFHQFKRRIVDIALGWQPHDIGTLRDLWDRLEDLPGEDRAAVHNLVADWAETATDNDKATLWRHIRSSYRSDPNDARLGLLLDRLSAQDLTAKHAWLFHNYYLHLPELDRSQMSHREIDSKIEQMRLNALREIWDNCGNDGASALIGRTDVDASLVGNILAQLLDSGATLEFARYCQEFQSSELKSHHEDCLRGLLWKADDEVVDTLANEAQNASKKLLFLLLCMPIQSSTWRRLDSQPSDFQSEYWQRIRFVDVRELTHTELQECVDRLLEVKRAALAFRAVHMFWDRVDTSRLKGLLIELPTSEPEDPALSQYEIVGAFEELNRRPDITTAEKAQLEFAYLEQLEYNDYGIPNLEDLVVSSPQIYADMIALIYKRNDGQEDDVDSESEGSARNEALKLKTYRILGRLRRIPGADEEGVVNVRALNNWLARTRELCASLGCREAGDRQIGEWLSHSPKGNDGRLPCRQVLEALESLKSPEVGQGFAIGTINQRGPQWRPIGGGGDPERELEKSYRTLAQGLAFDFPYVSRMMDDIADSYAHEADFWDKRDEVDARLYGM